MILIAGGYDKKIPYDVLGPEICKHVKKLFLGGATGPKIRAAVEAGVTLIDTAPCYGFGASEKVVGKALKGIRGKVILSTKCGLWWHDDRGSFAFEQAGHKVNKCLDADTIKREIELSLTRLDTDHIDVYFTHWQSIPPYITPIKETMTCLMDLKRQGLIKCIGASNVSKAHIDEYLE